MQKSTDGWGVKHISIFILHGQQWWQVLGGRTMVTYRKVSMCLFDLGLISLLAPPLQHAAALCEMTHTWPKHAQDIHWERKKMVSSAECVDTTCICLYIFAWFNKVLQSNLNAVIGEKSCERLICDFRCQIYAKKDPCGLDRCLCGGLIGDVI